MVPALDFWWRWAHLNGFQGIYIYIYIYGLGFRGLRFNCKIITQLEPGLGGPLDSWFIQTAISILSVQGAVLQGSWFRV